MADLNQIELPNGSTYNLSSYKLLSSDTRSDNQLPSWYMSNCPRCTVEEFKSCSAIGVNSIITGTYCVLHTITPWSDGSGGRPIQIAVSDSGIRAQRVATADNTWGSWVKLPNSDTNTTYTFANGTNGFTVTPSGGTAQTVTVTPSITNNVTGSGTSGYLTKFNGTHTITNGPQLGSSTTTYLNNAGNWATPPDTKNTAGSTDTSSKIFLIGATSQAANPQTYSDDQVYVTNGTLQANITNATVAVCANTAGSQTAGGISLYSTNQQDIYGIIFRGTSNKGKHGYVQSDWATYFTMNSSANRGWVFNTNGVGNVASVSNAGHAVFNGSVTIGGNTTNTSGARMEYNTTTQAIDFVFN